MKLGVGGSSLLRRAYATDSIEKKGFLSLFPGSPHFAGVILRLFSAIFVFDLNIVPGKLPPMGILHPSPIQELSIPALLQKNRKDIPEGGDLAIQVNSKE